MSSLACVSIVLRLPSTLSECSLSLQLELDAQQLSNQDTKSCKLDAIEINILVRTVKIVSCIVHATSFRLSCEFSASTVNKHIRLRAVTGPTYGPADWLYDDTCTP